MATKKEKQIEQENQAVPAAEAAPETKQIKVTLIRGITGRLQKQERTIRALGLTKIGESKVYTDSAAMRGMINVVSFMVRVEEIS